MAWEVFLHEAFAREVDDLMEPVRFELFAAIAALKREGPALRRPFADTLNGSSHANMKELRFLVDRQVWRAAYAFDPERNAVILCAAAKSGVNQRRFYAKLIALADRRFDDHLASVRMRRGQ